MKLTKTTALQAIAVVAWLWVKPAINPSGFYGSGYTTAYLIKSVVCFIVGLVVATYVPPKVGRKLAVPALVAGALLAVSYLFSDELYRPHIFEYRWLVGIIIKLGLPLIGFGLGAMRISWKPRSFAWSLGVLLALYAMYLGNEYLSRYIPIDEYYYGEGEVHILVIMKVYLLILYVLQVFIGIQLWRLMSLDCVIQAFEKIPKLTNCVAGLFWGMFLVPPAGGCSEFYEDVIMLLLAPVIAYIITVLLRAIYTAICNLIRFARSEQADWKNIFCWWK